MQFPRLPSIRPTKTWIVLGVALGIGVLAALVARGYLSSRLAEIEARAKGRTISLIVAKRELRKGERISEDTVAIRPIPVDYAHSQAIAPDSFERIEGQTLAFPVQSGEMVLWSLLEGKRTPTFSTRIATGRRAITVPVDEINSISGLLEPGDRIDLMVSIENNEKKHTFTLLQNVAVLATGQRSADDPKSGEKRLYSTVTLDTTPEQAQSIVSAREAGKLTALLRNPEDRAPLATGEAAAYFATGQAGQRNEVPVLYGGRSGRLPPEGLNLGQHGRPEARSDTLQPGPTAERPPAAPAAPVMNNLRRPE